MKLSVVDAHIYGGGALLTAGAALIYVPAGLIALGVLLVYLGLRPEGGGS